jgi:hypothetical protein
MAHPINPETQSLEDAFFRKRDAELLAEMRRRAAMQTHKKMLTEVSGITDDAVLEQLAAHNIQADTLAAFSLIPIIEVAWADGEIQPAERALLIRAIEETGIPKESISFQLLNEWIKIRPERKLMKLWTSYTQALMAEMPAEVGESIKKTILAHARSVAQAAGGFLGLGRTSSREDKVLQILEKAFKLPAKDR